MLTPREVTKAVGSIDSGSMLWLTWPPNAIVQAKTSQDVLRLAQSPDVAARMTFEVRTQHTVKQSELEQHQQNMVRHTQHVRSRSNASIVSYPAQTCSVRKQFAR